MKRSQIEKGEIGDFYWRYINLTSENKDLIDALEENTREIVGFLESIPDEKWSYKYGEDKWTVKEVIQHLIDTERIFQYRALCFSVMRKTPYLVLIMMLMCRLLILSGGILRTL
ncbi:DinB family protein [Christiangramia salexigens]|uniref:DinB family protein n=1 Tax=Christiangramia salexigens TaxID=1913577 RepID=UPI0009F80B56|nr:DinB family protein [Christiangramia salexigens]